MSNAINLLKDDHARMRELIAELARSGEDEASRRRQLLQGIGREWRDHSKLEEAVFYPAFKNADHKKHRRMYFEAIQAHRAIEELLLPDLVKTEPASLMFSGRAKVLKEQLEHHFDEEERRIFPSAITAMSAAELKDLGERMEEYREQLHRAP